ncbi:ribosomal-processing cysteine protease Prp [Parasporobacterium paucivorans]|uniref:Ribosomal processing cysteine protease Prp n=1 Tax=Parasporobacterium paucivorans DSM 15970 TaxID=1122934 RepID=A0A1M6A560_9FIRM|nr:ribosomal-processing cysteine protease Prp [Parasporobacterium paucivorans]SHI31616.1 hypothetical protein SAMN02745691_00067 [Parasporobacterium paucivorans DSM 15970]
MIKAVFFKSKEDYKGFTVTGHAGFAEYGKDVICASVSVLVINTINALDKFTSDRFLVDSDEDKGIIKLDFLSKNTNEAKLLMDALVLGLEGIRSNENKKYISIYFQEV